MYYLSFYYSGETYTHEIQPIKGNSVLNEALDFIHEQTSDPDVPFELKDNQGYIVATEEDI